MEPTVNENEPETPKEATPQAADTQPEATPAVTPSPVTAAANSPKGGKKRRLLLGGVVAVVAILLLGGGYTFAYYIPNKPENVYTKGLTNSGKAVDKLNAYLSNADLSNKKGADFNSSVKYSSASFSVDAQAKGSFDKDANADVQLKADLLGSSVSANIRSIRSAGNTSPDLYVQLNGVAKLLSQTGLGTASTLDGQWLKVDHTLVDTVKQKAKDNSSVAKVDVKLPSREEVSDAVAKVNEVNKQYLFTTDPAKAVLQNRTFVAKEQLNSRKAYHYTVGYSKPHLQAYAHAVTIALDGSKLNAWSQQVSKKNLSDQLDMKDLDSQIAKADANYRFDIWVDAKTKLLAQIKLVDPKDKTSYFTLGQSYDGGSVYPFSFSFKSSKEDAKIDTGTIGWSLDTDTGKVTFDIKGTTTGKSNSDFTVHVDVTPTATTVKPTAPAGAKSVNDILNSLGGQGVLGASTDTSKPTTGQVTQVSPEALVNLFQ